MNQALIAAVLVLSAALAAPAAASSSDSDFAAQLGAIRQAVADGAQTYKNKSLIRRATQESGPDDPLLLMQAPLIRLVKKVEPSIVLLESTIPNPQAGGKPGHFICTGFFIDASEMGRATVIATNAHCVEKLAVGAEIAVGLYNNDDNNLKRVKGKVLAFGSSEGAKDIAFVELVDPAQNRPGLPLWSKLDVGEQVVAIGNPRGLTFSVSQGIVSALERDHVNTRFALDVVQSDVALNPGNSGGPMFNMWGSVVGINSMIWTVSGGFDGISFALPSRYIVEAMRQYARTGDLKMGAMQISVSADTDTAKLVVRAVTPGGPADAAQIKTGDQLVNVDGIDLESLPPHKALTAFLAHVKYMSPGERIGMVLRREGQPVTLLVTLGEPKAPEPPRPEWAPIPPKKPAKPGPAGLEI